jgi:DNA repair protein RadC
MPRKKIENAVRNEDPGAYVAGNSTPEPIARSAEARLARVLLEEYPRGAILRAAQELVAGWEQALAPGEVVNSQTAGEKLIRLELAKHDPRREHFVVLYLNHQHGVLAVETTYHGTIDQASVWPRDIAARALELGAAAVLLGHNHPSGLAEPSPADRQITGKILDGLGLLQIRVLDHIIIAGGGHFSFAQRGLI